MTRKKAPPPPPPAPTRVARPAGGTATAAPAKAAAAQPAPAQDPERKLALEAYFKGDMKPMKALCERLLAQNPDDVFGNTNLGLIKLKENNYKEAETLYVRGLKMAPKDKVLNTNMAKLMLDQRRWSEAAEHARRAAETDPTFEIAWLNHSYACHMLGKLKEAEASARKVLALNPKSDQALNNLANALKDQGRVREAILAYKEALEIAPQNAMLYTNLQLTALYDATTPLEEIVAVARKFAEVFETPVISKRKPHRNTPLPNRRLRLGFISPDFTNHAVTYFSEPVLARLPRSEFEIYCYYTYAGGDYVTERIKGWADRFRYVPIMDPEKTAQMIQDDEIDILVDMAGHTAKNGLQAMAYKPAPVQVTWLGYPGTTGLKSIDWRITDHVADPPGVETTQYSEGLVRLPGTFCVYRPHIRSVLHRFDERYQVKPAPCLENGYITFGCCNNIAKITPPSIAAWSRVLQGVPGSKMLIEGKGLDLPEATAGMREQFASHGIDESRLIFVARDTRQQYLTYHRIDIALDPFPLTGGTTTFDALWMGVPVVTLLGHCFRERLSGTIVAGGGFKENIATSVDAYVQRAVALASDPQALAAARPDVRTRMQASVLMDEPRYVKLFGQALRGMWQKWCAAQEPAAAAVAPSLSEPELLVNINGRRITLAAAVALLRRLQRGDDKARMALPRVAQAILEVVPEQPDATAILAQVRFTRVAPGVDVASAQPGKASA